MPQAINLKSLVFYFLAFILAMNILLNLLCCFMLTIASVRALSAYSIDVIRIEKSITLGYT